jgi:hypothetical protein
MTARLPAREWAPPSAQPMEAPDACALTQDRAAEAMKTCPVCSARLQEHRCKLLCPTCGYFLSCSDFY